MIRYAIRGADKVAADLAAASGEQAIAQGTAAAAPVLKGSVQRETPVRTGFLRGSEDVLNLGSSLELHATAEYASYVAYGTSRQAANPYPDRGVDLAEPEVVREFETAAAALAQEFGQ